MPASPAPSPLWSPTPSADVRPAPACPGAAPSRPAGSSAGAPTPPEIPSEISPEMLSEEWIQETVKRLSGLPGLTDAQRTSYARWSRRYLRALAGASPRSALPATAAFAGRSRTPSADTLNAFLDWLARAGAPAADQREAVEALSFLHDVVLRIPVNHTSRPNRAAEQRPSVHLSPAEQKEVILRLRGADRLMARLAFAADLSPMEAAEVRVGDLTLPAPHQTGPAAEASLVVRDVAGRTVRRVVLSSDLAGDLHQHLRRVRSTFERDRDNGCAAAPIPAAVESAFPGSAENWVWQMVFPAPHRARDGRTGQSVRLSSGPTPLLHAIRALTQTDRRALSVGAC